MTCFLPSRSEGSVEASHPPQTTQRHAVLGRWSERMSEERLQGLGRTFQLVFCRWRQGAWWEPRHRGGQCRSFLQRKWGDKSCSQGFLGAMVCLAFTAWCVRQQSVCRSMLVCCFLSVFFLTTIYTKLYHIHNVLMRPNNFWVSLQKPGACAQRDIIWGRKSRGFGASLPPAGSLLCCLLSVLFPASWFLCLYSFLCKWADKTTSQFACS